jgi:hypothetical protein
MEGTRFEFAERAGALALFIVASGKVASLRHRLTREMKAKCYKNMSAGAKISSIAVKSDAVERKKSQPAAASAGCDLRI